MRPRSLLTALTVATLVAAPLLPGGPVASASTPSPLTSPTVAESALPGTLPLLLRGATVLPALPALTSAAPLRQRVVLALALRDQDGLDQLLAAQQSPGTPDYQRWLTPGQFTERFGPTTGSVALALSWARSAGLAVEEVSSNHTLVTVSGTPTQLGRAFGVQLRALRTADSSYLTPDRPATLPPALRAVSAAVLGLTTYNPARLATHLAPAPATTAGAPYRTYGTSYGPSDFAAIYHAPAATTGSGQTVAIITQGNLSGVRKDLATFQRRNHLPAVALTVIQTTATSTDISGADEYDLDSQYSSGFAPGVSTLLAYNSDTLGDIHPLNRFVTDRRSRTASASYGGCETLNSVLGLIAADDAVFKQADAQGQTFWVSSGDAGSSCSVLVNTGTPAGVPNVEYPASSPYVVAVGGTSLTGQSTQPTREVSWIGGGGGYSTVEAAPAWQHSSTTFQPALGRGVPDVSLDADPNSGYLVVVAGVDTVIGGTSASAPAWNGIWARTLQRNPRLGFAAPALYRAKAGLVDITVGSNGAYPATPGYDLSTGLGSADISALVESLKR